MSCHVMSCGWCRPHSTCTGAYQQVCIGRCNGLLVLVMAVKAHLSGQKINNNLEIEYQM